MISIFSLYYGTIIKISRNKIKLKEVKTIQRTNVSSSNLQSVGYDFDNQILEIEFKDGSIYQYPNVPYHLYQGLMNTNSHGSYFWKYIRNKFNEYQIY